MKPELEFLRELLAQTQNARDEICLRFDDSETPNAELNVALGEAYTALDRIAGALSERIEAA